MLSLLFVVLDSAAGATATAVTAPPGLCDMSQWILGAIVFAFGFAMAVWGLELVNKRELAPYKALFGNIEKAFFDYYDFTQCEKEKIVELYRQSQKRAEEGKEDKGRTKLLRLDYDNLIDNVETIYAHFCGFNKKERKQLEKIVAGAAARLSVSDSSDSSSESE